MQSIGKAFIIFTAVVLLVTVAQAAPLCQGSVCVNTGSLASKYLAGSSHTTPTAIGQNSAILTRCGIPSASPTGMATSTPHNSLQGAYVRFPGDTEGFVAGEISSGIADAAAARMTDEGENNDLLVLLFLSSGSVVGFDDGELAGYWSY
jgi:hypothetical protein